MSDTAPQTNDHLLVSVVIPTRNRRDILDHCLKALVNQTYPRYEIIVVDDASTDDTPQYLEHFAADHPDLAFRWLRSDQPRGANRSRNRGIRAARGDIIAFEDSDCIAEPDWIEKLVSGFTHDRVASVSGLVEDPPPTNIFELTFAGTHRLRPGPASRLVAGNMAIRRPLLLERPLDEDLRWGCDEEGIYHWLRVKGYEQRVVPEAVVHHEHYYDARAFFRQAFKGGEAAARFVYKYHLPTRLDMLPFILTLLTLPLTLIDLRLALVPAIFLALAVAAVLYNERVRKGKTIGQIVRIFPVLIAYYAVRLAGYLYQVVRLRLTAGGTIRRERLTRQSPSPEASRGL